VWPVASQTRTPLGIGIIARRPPTMDHGREASDRRPL
jgi:hypothetical protein